MSLAVLVVIVVVGIAATVIAVHLTGGGKRATLAGTEHARKTFGVDFPDEPVGPVTLTTDGQSAFLVLPGGRIGIVQSFGDGFFTRIVSRKDIASLKMRAPATVSIRFRDFTWTGGHFAFAEPGAAVGLANALAPADQPA